MEHIRQQDQLTIIGDEPLTSTSVERFQQYAQELIEAKKPTKVIIDLEQVNYISSTGLRAFLKLAKQGLTIEIVNASSEVYEIFDVTGFTSIFPISRKMRNISVENAELIGSGFFSRVYRISEDSIIKVFIRDTSLENIKREQELAKNAFVLGIPAAITFDIVQVDGKYGLLFESINGGTFTQKILSDPEHLEENIIQYAQLLKTINTTKAVSGNLPSAAAIADNKLQTIRPNLTDEEYTKLSRMLGGIEDTRTFVHADCHTGNIMLQNGELLIIDLDTLSVGNPIFELASLYCTFIVFEECEPGNNMQFLKMPKEITDRLFYRTMTHYFRGLTEQELTENIRKIQVCGYLHALYWNTVNKPEDTHMFEVCRRRLQECLQQVDDLTLQGI